MWLLQVKLLDLDRQKHKIEVKKRVMPERDYSYDETQISNTEKRLGANIASFYLERKMKFPMRLKSVSDISTTPLVRKARQALKLQDVTKSADPARSERAQTAKSMSSELTTASPVRPVKLNRRNSRSAPLVSRSYNGHAARDEPRLPAITDGPEGRNKSGHVKFMFEDPLKILTTKDKDMDDGASLLSRAYTYHPGMGHDRGRFHSQDFFLEASDDEDDPYLPDHIDLRALLFDREGRRDEAVSMKSIAHGSHVPTPILRRSNAYAPKITQELIQQENEQVQSKVDRFLQELHEHAMRQDDSDSDLEEDIFSTVRTQRPSTVQVPPIKAGQPSESTEETTSEGTCVGRRQKLEETKTPRIPKDAWKYIRGRSVDGSLRGTYTAEDLVLQALTGVPLRRSLTAGIPLHSAGRAMRHTATFKMRKVVDRLINDRTKYQQHEIEELKRKMESGMDLATAAASLTPGPVPSAGALSRHPSRASESVRPISQGVNG